MELYLLTFDNSSFSHNLSTNKRLFNHETEQMETFCTWDAREAVDRECGQSPRGSVVLWSMWSSHKLAVKYLLLFLAKGHTRIGFLKCEGTFRATFPSTTV